MRVQGVHWRRGCRGCTSAGGAGSVCVGGARAQGGGEGLDLCGAVEGLGFRAWTSAGRLKVVGYICPISGLPGMWPKGCDQACYQG